MILRRLQSIQCCRVRDAICFSNAFSVGRLVLLGRAIVCAPLGLWPTLGGKLNGQRAVDLLQLHQEIHVVWIRLDFRHEFLLLLYAQPLSCSAPWFLAPLSLLAPLCRPCSSPSFLSHLFSPLLIATLVSHSPSVAW